MSAEFGANGRNVARLTQQQHLDLTCRLLLILFDLLLYLGIFTRVGVTLGLRSSKTHRVPDVIGSIGQGKKGS